jgi:alpha-tubulin suppressor-like RCC1 family protein
VRLSDGTIRTFGTNANGELGYGTSDSASPVTPSLSDVSQTSGGWYFSAAIQKDGTRWTWGNNGWGELGDGTTVANRRSPTHLTSLTDVAEVAAGTNPSHAIAVTTNGGGALAAPSSRLPIQRD